jgi:phosphatidate cytidylyltransferase
MRNELLLILGTIGAFLTLASLAGFLLSVRGGARIALVENLNARINTWWWIVLVLGTAVLTGRAIVIALFAAISFIALREFLTLTAVQAGDRRAVVATFLVIVPVQYVLVALGRYDWFAGFLPLFGLLLVPILTVLAGDVRNYLARTAELLWGLVMCVYCISHVPALLMLRLAGDRDRPVLLMLFLIVIAQASDVLQYTWGKLIGRRKIVPEISPSKTVGGTIGGIVSATALGASLSWMTPFTVVQAGVMALLIALAGFLGGLVMSAIKRDRGVKDWSRLMPGHGGILDRVDSICFSAPMFFYLSHWFVGS